MRVEHYTGGILQRLDTDVHSADSKNEHSAVTVKTSTALLCDSDGMDSNVTALTVTALGNQWL